MSAISNGQDEAICGVSYRVSNLRTSAWEYAAPTTRLEPSRPAGFVALLLAVLSRNGGLQNGEADL